MTVCPRPTHREDARLAVECGPDGTKLRPYSRALRHGTRRDSKTSEGEAGKGTKEKGSPPGEPLEEMSQCRFLKAPEEGLEPPTR
jgi:hypothetical protein